MQEALLRLHGVLDRGEHIEVPEAVPRHRRHPARHRSAPLGTAAPGDLRRRVAPRASGHRRPDDPATHAEMSDSLSLAFLVLLERLSPEQRAVFLLREVFDYDYDAIAEIVGKSEAACRQLAVRARRHVDAGPAALRGVAPGPRRVGARFLTATQTGDLGRARSAARPRRRAARRRRRQGAGDRPPTVRAPPRRPDAAHWMRFASSIEGFSIRPVDVNGHPGALGLDGQQRVLYVMSLRHRRRSDPRHPLDRQPRQAAPPRPGVRRPPHPGRPLSLPIDGHATDGCFMTESS